MDNPLGRKPKVVIVGAGISGLSLAFRLSQLAREAELTVLEENGRAGGTIWTERHEGLSFEIGPNGFLDNKPSTMALSHELDLGHQLVAASPAAGRNRFIFLDGRLHKVPSGPASLLWSRLLSFKGKLNLLAEPLWRPSRRHSDESIYEFACRRFGCEAADVLADALVTGILAGDPKLLSVKAAFPILVEIEERYGSIIKGFAKRASLRRAEARLPGAKPTGASRLWSFQGGLRTIVEALVAKLGHRLCLNAGVRRIERIQDAKPGQVHWRLHGGDGTTWDADAVALACPAFQQASILAGLNPVLAHEISGIAYSGVVVAAVAFRREHVLADVDGFGFIAPQRLRRDVLGVQWCSSIFPDRAPADLVLMRAMCGGWNRPDILSWSDAEIIEAVRSELRLALGITAEPVLRHLTRWPRAIPQYHRGHCDRLTAIEGHLIKHPGLFLGGNAYRGVALNDCTHEAEVQAAAICRFLRMKWPAIGQLVHD